ncbi:bifunctional heptose 7-phosphate kinase/heptose 1-phosphate adenyltransferase [Nocardia bhagyanarayanae]|uniref:PfkB family carbohydrate kinase n=1 Tax=Nocardia bhagyanarayanae TaxID=1215925 RepID=A0A543EY41_9NOCA|nr:PfkB family carbohydrate kinase [Nocardia bhagyanarayanae]TQM26498.1 pfkB family carbohydrate kinase [Nocardia bhagyanarayanae]
MISGAPLVVVGDALLDIEVVGRADRHSPDAPVPVVDVTARSFRPGGAGLAALLSARDVDDVVLVAGFADDSAGERLRALLPKGIRLVRLPFAGSTVCKERVRAVGPCAGPSVDGVPAPITRLDSGDGRVTDEPLDEDVRTAIGSARAVLIADYGRGAAAHPEIRALIEARARRAPVVWDPHPRGPEPVRGAALVTPNRDEAERFVPGGTEFGSRARTLTDRWAAKAVAVTLGAEGAVLYCRGLPGVVPVPLPVERRASANADTCGAGDRFASAAAVAMADGAGTEKSVRHAVASAAEFVRAGAASAFAITQTEAAMRLRVFATESAHTARNEVRNEG